MERTVISNDEWDTRLNAINISKEEMNRLVMDYLVVEGYQTAAEEFSRDANIEPPVDLGTIERRMRILSSVSRGEIEDAISQLNDLHPEILDENPQLYFHLQQQRLIEYIRHNQIYDALVFAQTTLAPLGSSNSAFLSELEVAMSLLAFDSTPLSEQPAEIAQLLQPSQRRKVAQEVKAAILENASQGKESQLTGLVKLMTWGENLLSSKVDFPRVDPDLALNASGSKEKAD